MKSLNEIWLNLSEKEIEKLSSSVACKYGRKEKGQEVLLKKVKIDGKTLEILITKE